MRRPTGFAILMLLGFALLTARAESAAQAPVERRN